MGCRGWGISREMYVKCRLLKNVGGRDAIGGIRNVNVRKGLNKIDVRGRGTVENTMV